jgi:hypothetical protein
VRSMAARGYGAAHFRLRAKVKLVVDRGEAVCWRCRRLIVPGTPWDLGHSDRDRSVYMGPEHRGCNRATSAHRAARRRAQRRSRAW